MQIEADNDGSATLYCIHCDRDTEHIWWHWDRRWETECQVCGFSDEGIRTPAGGYDG